MKKNLNYLIILFVAVLPFFSFTCNKENEDTPNIPPDNTAPSFSFDLDGNELTRWTATKIEKPIIGGGYLFIFENNGTTVYNKSLKSVYPDLTERIYLALFTTDLKIGKYVLKYGPDTQGSAELSIKQSSAPSAANADSLYRISEIGPESYFQINKIENSKMSGEFYFYIFQPITGASSLKILECKKGAFRNIPIK